MTAKIAIIEDNPDNLELMAYLLRHFGYNLVIAVDGEEGIKLVEQETPDLIICDIQLPKLNGYQIAAHIKANPSLAHIPLIAVTAYSMLGDRDTILAAGFDNYISKPIDPESFVKDIQRFLLDNGSKSPSSVPISDSAKTITHSVKNTEKTILVVDDTRDNLELLNILLTSAGYQTILAETVQIALMKLEKQIPNLIISDLHLPEIDGLEFIRSLKGHERFRNIPTIILSASKPVAKERQECLALGVLQFIIQPIEAEDFIKIINEICREN